jgi:hypothetical protein
MDKVRVVINELLLESSIVALNVGINLRAARIGEEMGNPISPEYYV